MTQPEPETWTKPRLTAAIHYLDGITRTAERRIEELAKQTRELDAQIALVKAMCTAVDWDTAEAKGVGVALHGGSGRPETPKPVASQSMILPDESPSDYWYRQYCELRDSLTDHQIH